MLRSKGLSEKVLLLGIDGLDPKFTKRMLKEGYMPNTQKLIEKGAAREDLMLLGGIPTVTPPMWTTLATGAYPMTHGVEDFNITKKGELDINFAGIYSNNVKAEPLWNITADAGKKTLVWHWPGGAWPPTSDNPNLMVVDGTSPGALGFGYAMRDMEGVVFASGKVPESKFHYGAANDTDELVGDEKIKRYKSSRVVPPHHQDYWDELIAQFIDEVGDFQGFKPDTPGLNYRTEVLLGTRSQMDDLHKYPKNITMSTITEPEGWGFEVPEGAKEITWIYGMTPLFR